MFGLWTCEFASPLAKIYGKREPVINIHDQWWELLMFARLSPRIACFMSARTTCSSPCFGGMSRQLIGQESLIVCQEKSMSLLEEWLCSQKLDSKRVCSELLLEKPKSATHICMHIYHLHVRNKTRTQLSKLSVTSSCVLNTWHRCLTMKWHFKKHLPVKTRHWLINTIQV